MLLPGKRCSIGARPTLDKPRTLYRFIMSQASIGSYAGLYQRDLLGHKWRIEQMPLLLVNAKEVGDEVHTIGEVSPILCAALLQAIRSHVYACQHFSQLRIVDLIEHLWEMFRSNLVPGEVPRCWTDEASSSDR
jgi:hypothetical protein